MVIDDLNIIRQVPACDTPSSSLVSIKGMLDQLSDLIQDHITENNKLNILIVTKNMDDGIGDFIHHMDIGTWLTQATNSLPHVNIKCFSYVGKDKQKIAYRLMSDEVRLAGTYVVPQGAVLDKNKAEDAQYIIWADDSESFATNYFVHEADCIINISRPLTPFSNLGKFIQQQGQRVALRSLTENASETYSATSHFQGIYIEESMGVGKNTVGIKINERIRAMCHDGDMPHRLYQIENKHLLVCLLGAGNAERYLQNHLLTIGYLQSKESTLQMLKYALVISGEKHVDAFVNISYFDTLSEEAELLQFLQNEIFSKIEVINQEGHVT